MAARDPVAYARHVEATIDRWVQYYRSVKRFTLTEDMIRAQRLSHEQRWGDRSADLHGTGINAIMGWERKSRQRKKERARRKSVARS